MSILNGTDLILSVNGHALGFSTGCKISTSIETGERKTKEETSGRWVEKYTKSISETITADGCVQAEGSDEKPSYNELKKLALAGEPVTAHYSIREGNTREGKKNGGYTGKFIITQIDCDGPVSDDSKYSITLVNSGPVTPVAESKSVKGK